MPNMKLGEILKFIRTDIFGLSLLDFSELMSLSSSALQRYESEEFGKKFTNNKYLKLRDISERISSVVFEGYEIVRKTKKVNIDNNVIKMGFNTKIKDELDVLYIKNETSTKENINRLKSINISTENGLAEYIYTFFLLYLGMEVNEDDMVFKKNINGIIKIVDTNKDRISDYKKCLLEAKGECFITGTSMVHLSEDSGEVLIRKAKTGNVKLLILDPDWIDKNSQLLTFLDNDSDRKEFSFEIRNSIRKLKAIRRRLDKSLSNKIILKKYSTIFPYIITGYENINHGKMVVEITDYLPESFRPRFTLQKSKNNDFYNVIKRKFDSLWNNQELTREVTLDE